LVDEQIKIVYDRRKEKGGFSMKKTVIINIYNFIRSGPSDQAEFMVDDFETIRNEILTVKQYGFPGTYALKHDALMDKRYQELLKTYLDESDELGAWWEITDDMCRRAGISFRNANEVEVYEDQVQSTYSLGYTPEGANVFPVEKDDTDAMLAVRRGIALGCRDFLLYGSLDGPRLDHTVANFQTLQFLADNGCRGVLVGSTTLVTLVKNGSISFPAGCSGTLSVFCHGPIARGVTLEGLYYPLKKGTLNPGFPLGASNHFTGEKATITVEEGSLLILWNRQAGLPIV
jgi:thiamine pyrophosphokinase